VTHINSSQLDLLTKLLRLGSACQFYLVAKEEPEDAIRSLFVLAGYVNVQLSLAAESHVAHRLLNPSSDQSTKVMEVKASKPSWKAGTSAPISLKPKRQPVQQDQSVWGAVAENKTVTLGAADLIDEDSLLDEGDLAKPTVETKAGCPPTRKACANCSCGRADQEKKAAVLGDLDADAQAEPIKSSCGSCGLGDAFRCASCPHLGLPPFEKGQEGKVLLDKNLLAMDL